MKIPNAFKILHLAGRMKRPLFQNSCSTKLPMRFNTTFRSSSARFTLIALVATILFSTYSAELNYVPSSGSSVAAFAETVDTFASDCVTPTLSFNLGQTVCAKSAGAGALLRRIQWLAPNGRVARQTANLASGSQQDSFTIPTSGEFAQVGTWSVRTVDSSNRGKAFARIVVSNPAVPAVNLSVVNTSGAGDFAVPNGTNVSFKMLVFNEGPDDAQNAQLTAPVPANTTFVSASQDSGPAFTPTNPEAGGTGSSTYTIASLAKDATAVFTITYKVDTSAPAGSIISSVATVSSSTAERSTTAGDNTSTARAFTPGTVTTPDGETLDTAPTPCILTCPANITQAAASGATGATVTYTTGADSTCSDISCTPPSGSVFPVGVNTVVCDSANAPPCSFTVTITGGGVLAITLNGDNPFALECGTDFADPGASAHDADGNSLAVTVTGTVNENTSATYTLTYTATDGTGTVSATRTVNVSDTTAPVVTLNGDATLTVECQAPFIDPGATAVDACAGTVSVTTTVRNSANQVIPSVPNNIPGTYTVTYSATDGTRTGTAVRTVIRTPDDESPPTITLNGDETLEVECHSNFVDPGATAVDACVGIVNVSATSDVNANVVGSYTIIYSATDGTNSATLTRFVTVVDTTAPVIVLNGPNPLMVGCHNTYVDPGATAVDACAGSFAAAAAGTVNTSVLGDYTITYTATDPAGHAAAPVTRVVRVVNFDPAVTITGPPTGSLFAINTAVNFTGTFTDAEGGAHTAEWLFDAISQPATVVEPSGATPGTANATYTFTTAGVYFVKLRVSDSCGGTGEAKQIGDLDAIVVIYDPSGGYVTGGGWFNSLAGFYRDPLVSGSMDMFGKANFGFVSKYHNGTTIPTGQTEFQFKAGNFNFKSTAYEWLVIAGARAQYKGTGTVNGVGSYGFILTAIDGQVTGGGGTDKFRMKIWDKNNGDAIVYDNQAGANEDANPTTTLGGGSIVIHKAN